MVKTVFESDASFKSCHKKMEEITLDACQSAYVSLCQLLLGEHPSSRSGFYAATY
jgi:hypothetical protein